MTDLDLLYRDLFQVKRERARVTLKRNVEKSFDEFASFIESLVGHPFVVDIAILRQIWANECYTNGAALGPKVALPRAPLYRIQQGTSFGPVRKSASDQGIVYLQPEDRLYRCDTWTPLSQFCKGIIGFRSISFWTSENPEVTISSREFSDSVRPLLRSGVYRVQPRLLLCKINPDCIKKMVANVPTELDCVDNCAFYQTSNKTKSRNGWTIDITSVDTPELGTPEYVLSGVQAEDVWIRTINLPQPGITNHLQEIRSAGNAYSNNMPFKSGFEIVELERLTPAIMRFLRGTHVADV